MWEAGFSNDIDFLLERTKRTSIDCEIYNSNCELSLNSEEITTDPDIFLGKGFFLLIFQPIHIEYATLLYMTSGFESEGKRVCLDEWLLEQKGDIKL